MLLAIVLRLADRPDALLDQVPPPPESTFTVVHLCRSEILHFTSRAIRHVPLKLQLSLFEVSIKKPLLPIIRPIQMLISRKRQLAKSVSLLLTSLTVSGLKRELLALRNRRNHLLCLSLSATSFSKTTHNIITVTS